MPPGRVQDREGADTRPEAPKPPGKRYSRATPGRARRTGTASPGSRWLPPRTRSTVSGEKQPRHRQATVDPVTTAVPRGSGVSHVTPARPEPAAGGAIFASVAWARDTSTPLDPGSNHDSRHDGPDDHAGEASREAQAARRDSAPPRRARYDRTSCQWPVRGTAASRRGPRFSRNGRSARSPASGSGRPGAPRELRSGDPVPVGVQDRQQREEERRDHDDARERPATLQA
jgi:hypothetical protein